MGIEWHIGRQRSMLSIEGGPRLAGRSMASALKHLFAGKLALVALLVLTFSACDFGSAAVVARANVASICGQSYSSTGPSGSSADTLGKVSCLDTAAVPILSRQTTDDDQDVILSDLDRIVSVEIRSHFTGAVTQTEFFVLIPSFKAP